MDHLTLANFKFGLDTRRSELTSNPGSLVTADNGHINQGAQFEKRKAFVLLGQLPANCFGLQETPNGLMTFGSATPPAMPAGLAGLVTYQRLRHYIWALDKTSPQLAAEIFPPGSANEFNPDGGIPSAEPLMTSLSYSCTFGGYAFAIASFGPEQNTGVIAFNPTAPITLSFYNGNPVTSSWQGNIPFSNNGNVGGAAFNAWTTYWLLFAANYYIGSTFTFSLGLGPDANLTGPINTPFSVVVSDTVGGAFSSSVVTLPAAPVTGIGATTTIYFTKGSSGKIDTLTAPTLSATGGLGAPQNLINSAVNFSTSLYQTAINLASAINNVGTGYTAQANLVSATVASVTITAPISYGAAVNTGQVAIHTTTIFNSLNSTPNTGAAGAQNYVLVGGTTAASGVSQVEGITLGVPPLAQGSYQADLVFNNLTTSFGAGYLTRKRSMFCFFLVAGASGSVDSISINGGANFLSASVPFNTSLQQTCLDIVSNIQNQYGGILGSLEGTTTWVAFPISVNGLFGVAVGAPLTAQESLNGVNNVVISSTTITLATVSTNFGAGVTSLITSLAGGNSDPTFACSLGGKLYLARGSRINFSASYNAARWEQQDIGAGFITFTDMDTSPSSVLSLCPFQGQLAAFARRNISLWNVNADPAQYSVAQNLKNIGTMAPLSVQPIGEFDTLFLSDTGIRSLRVRETTLNAYVVDVGSPIDDLIQAALLVNTGASACSIVEPSSNRYWCYLNGVIYVLSYFPSLKIIAWSTYQPTTSTVKLANTSNDIWTNLTVGRQYTWNPGGSNGTFQYNLGLSTNPGQSVTFIATSTIAGYIGTDSFAQTGVVNKGKYALYESIPFTPVKFLVYNGQVYVLDSNNNVYVYGGTNNNTYDSTVPILELPWLDAKTPQRIKSSESVNAAMSGEWLLYLAMDPRAGSFAGAVPENTGASGQEANDSTFDEGVFGVSRVGTHMKVRAVCDPAWTNPATFSAVTVNYSLNETQ
jgi:hypothetical protein